MTQPTRVHPIHRLPRPSELSAMPVEEVYASFVLADLIQPGQVVLRFTDLDRMVVGAVTPNDGLLELPEHPETGTERFLDRREMGIINVGGPGTLILDGLTHRLDRLDGAYVSRGTRTVAWASENVRDPAKFFLLSCPAHESRANAIIRREDTRTLPLGTAKEANRRIIRQYIHPQGQGSCQLVMGYTELLEGSVWNTFPPHTHNRRTEVYFYFNLGERVVAHFLGEPSATRHVFLHDGHAVLSPSWSIHSGCGQGDYCFIWGMAGENQVFSDMDAVPVRKLR